MTKTIRSRTELKSEIERLTIEKQISEQRLNTMIREFSVAMKPMNLLKNAFTSVKNDSELSKMIKNRSIEAIAGFIISQLVFKKSNLLVRTAATLMGTSFASGVFGDGAIKYIDKLKQLVKKFKSKTGKETSETFKEEDNYS